MPLGWSTGIASISSTTLTSCALFAGSWNVASAASRMARAVVACGSVAAQSDRGVDIPRTGRGDAAPRTWRWVAATPRPGRGYSVEMGRGDAAPGT